MSELAQTEDALLAALKTIRTHWAGLLEPSSPSPTRNGPIA